MMLYVNPSVIGAFTMITTVSAILFMFVWTIILCSCTVYRKQRPHLHEKSIYKMPLGKLMLGMYGVLCLRTGAADSGRRYPSGVDGDAAVVHRAGSGLVVYR